MSWRGAASFYSQLASILRAGLPIAQALEHAGNATVGFHRQRASLWSKACAAGQALSTQLRNDGEEPLAIALVQAGESSGRLPEMCLEIANLNEHRCRLRSLFITKMVYPILQLHALLVLPVFPAVYLGQQPAIALLYGPFILWAAIAALFALNAFFKRSGVLARIALFPFVRTLTMPLVAGNTCLILRAGVAAGMLHHQSLELAADGCGNRIFSERIREIARGLSSGAVPTLTSALTALDFPKAVVQLCSNGEVSGQLEETLGRCANLLQESFQQRTLWTVKILSAVFYGLIMLAIAAKVISFYAGMYQDAAQEIDQDS